MAGVWCVYVPWLCGVGRDCAGIVGGTDPRPCVQVKGPGSAMWAASPGPPKTSSGDTLSWTLC